MEDGAKREGCKPLPAEAMCHPKSLNLVLGPLVAHSEMSLSPGRLAPERLWSGLEHSRL